MLSGSAVLLATRSRPSEIRIVERPLPVGQCPFLQAAVAERAIGGIVLRRPRVGDVECVWIGEEVVFRAQIDRHVFADKAGVDVVGVRGRDGDFASAARIAKAGQHRRSLAAVGLACRQGSLRAELADLVTIGRAGLAVGRDKELAVDDLHLPRVLGRTASGVRAGDRRRGVASERRKEDAACRVVSVNLESQVTSCTP